MSTTALALASGCSTTLVQYLPTGTTTTCDAAWPGLWKASSPPAEDRAVEDKPDFAWVEISADCKQYTFTDAEKTSVEKKSLTLVTSQAGDFLSIAEADDKPECLNENNSDCGLPLVRYVRDGDEIRLYTADHRRVSEAIAKEGVTGLTKTTPVSDPAKPAAEKTAKPQIKNLLTGTPEQIAQLLADHPDFFESTPWLVLHREKTDTRPKPAAKQP